MSRMSLSPPPPPLPSSLSSRFLQTINPLTGSCRRHPSVQLCELTQNNSRWVVRRKTCSKCGARAPAADGRHMPGVCVRVDNPVQDRTRTRSAPPARDRHQAKPARRRQSCAEREDCANNIASSFKSHTTSTGSFSRSGSGSNSTKSEAKKIGKLEAPKSNEPQNSTSRRGRKKDILPTVNFNDASPPRVRFAITPYTVLPHIPPPPFHPEVLLKSRIRKQSSMYTVEEDIIKNVGCIYFYPLT